MNNLKKNYKQYSALILIALILIILAPLSYSDQDIISLFPIEHYDQTVSAWVKPTDANFDKNLLTAEIQQKHFDLFYEHYFSTFSPWNPDYINQILRQPPPDNLKTIEQSIITQFSDPTGHGENFRPYPETWIEVIANNINISQLDNVAYNANNRGIAIDNLHARALPTDDVYFYSYKLPGQGYPFDYLQMSALWAGTPVYIIAESRDHAWFLVMTPDYIGWVKSRGIARADNAFISTWTLAAKNKLAAITHTQTGILDDQNNFLFTAYVGSVFPVTTSTEIMVPASNGDHHAIIKKASIANEYLAVMPLAATPHHFSNMINSLIGHPYGWGNMYFYNDCSAELKNLLTPFGIWLPRHSSDQVMAGKMIDMTPASAEKRLAYLTQNGAPFLTLIYIGGHVILYIGNYPDKNKNLSSMAMTYQNIWGLSPRPSTRRSVIGKAVLFPMLLQYPEDTALISLADKKFFQVSYLNELPDASFFIKQKMMSIKSLMYPDGIYN